MTRASVSSMSSPVSHQYSGAFGSSTSLDACSPRVSRARLSCDRPLCSATAPEGSGESRRGVSLAEG
eukprot:4845044-Alexandrium_andersonii.AAC.1